MLVRVGSLAVGTRFTTALTGRQGRVVGRHETAEGAAVDAEMTRVTGLFTLERLALSFHPDVRVRVVEVTH